MLPTLPGLSATDVGFATLAPGGVGFFLVLGQLERHESVKVDQGGVRHIRDVQAVAQPPLAFSSENFLKYIYSQSILWYLGNRDYSCSRIAFRTSIVKANLGMKPLAPWLWASC